MESFFIDQVFVFDIHRVIVEPLLVNFIDFVHRSHLWQCWSFLSDACEHLLEDHIPGHIGVLSGLGWPESEHTPACDQLRWTQ